MIHLVVCEDSVGGLKPTAHCLTWEGQTPRELVESFNLAGHEVDVRVHEKLVLPELWDDPLPRHTEVLISPRMHGTETLIVIGINLLVSALISVASYYLFPPPKPKTQQGLDDNSSTYGFGGLRTLYRTQGQPIPFGFGKGRLPGNTVASSTADNGVGGEDLQVILSWCHGEIEGLGDLSASEIDFYGSLDQLPPPGRQLPQGIRINGVPVSASSLEVPGMVLSYRTGRDRQSPLPISRLTGTSTTIGIGTRLEGLNDTAAAVIAVGGPYRLRLNLRADAGLYSLDGNGNLTPRSVVLRVRYRAGDGPFQDARFISPTIATGQITITGSDRTPKTISLEFDPRPLGQELDTPVVVEIARYSGRGGVRDSDLLTVSSLVYTQAVVLEYPNEAVGEFVFRASEKISSSQPDISCFGRWSKVRMWDETLGWSPLTFRTLDPPWLLGNLDPGENPAWQLLHFLLDPAGGNYQEEDLDLQSFRNLADYCAQEVAVGVQRYAAMYAIDTVSDTANHVDELLNACQAQWARNGKKLGVRYSYRDFHGFGTNVVPARATDVLGEWVVNYRQVFNQTNLRDFGRKQLETHERATQFDVEFNAEDQDYERDSWPVPDPNPEDPTATVTLNSKPMRLRAVTSREQAERMARFQHNVNRLSKWRISFTAGIDAWGLAPNDLIGVEHDSVTPRSVAGRTADGFVRAFVSEVPLDVGFEVPANEQWALWTRTINASLPGGYAIEKLLIPTSASVQSFPAGTPIPISPSRTLDQGAPVSIGPVDESLIAYEITEITLDERGTRRIEAIEWHPEFYDLGDTATAAATSGGPSATATSAPAIGIAPQHIPKASDIAAYVTGVTAGELDIVWSRPVGYTGSSCRVWLEEGSAWRMVGETRGGSLTIPAGRLSPRSEVTIAVALEDGVGSWQSAAEAGRSTIIIPEFPDLAVPPVPGFAAAMVGDRLRASWGRLDPRSLTAVELRSGSQWMGSRRLITVDATRDHVELPLPYTPNTKIWARGIHRSGLYSASAITADVSVDYEPGLIETGAPLDVLDSDPLEGTLSGGFVQLGDRAELKLTGEFSGVMTSDEFEPRPAEAKRRWSVFVDWHEIQDRPISDLEGIASGDARWWSAAGRESSPAMPGLTFGVPISTYSGPMDQLPWWLTTLGPLGAIGSTSHVVVEWRFFAGGAWSAWREVFAPEWVLASKVQARVTAFRAHTRSRVVVSKFMVACAS